MEALLASKPRSVAIGVIRALVVPLRERWGSPERFADMGLDVLAREGGGALYSEKDSPAHLEQIYRQVVRARATYFRPIENPAQLEHLHRELDLNAAKAASPLQQGVLWLASRLQQQAIAYLQNPRTDKQIAQLLEAVAPRRGALLRGLGDVEKLTLDRVEAVLGALAKDVTSGSLGPFEQSAIAGHLLEIVRTAARQPPPLNQDEAPLPENEPTSALLGTLIEPVRRAELNEARQRYARFSEDEKNRRYNEFRRALPRIAAEVAAFAPIGFERFCEAVEARLYPYPEPLQFIRSYARPIWNNGSQSSLFTNVTTPQGVQSTYETLVKSRQGNPVVLEIARAFALRAFRQAGQEGGKAVLHEVDLKSEFGWPSTMDELKAALE